MSPSAVNAAEDRIPDLEQIDLGTGTVLGRISGGSTGVTIGDVDVAAGVSTVSNSSGGGSVGGRRPLIEVIGGDDDMDGLD